MIPVSRLSVFLILAIMALIGFPMALGSYPSFENVAAAVPITIAVEFLVYFSSCFIFNSRMTLPSIAFISLAMVLARGIASGLSSILLDLLVAERAAPGMVAAWVGNPVSVVLQAVAMMIVAPQLIATQAEGSGDSPSAASRDPRASRDSAPAGGFVQVFSFDDLSGVLRKTPGLEGYIIHSSEGLVVWKELPMRLATDEVAARLVETASSLGNLAETNGLSRLKKTIVQTREHLLFVADLNPNFGMILIYSGRTKLADCDARIEILARTAREFLQWKYPGLTMASSTLSQTAVPAVS